MKIKYLIVVKQIINGNHGSVKEITVYGDEKKPLAQAIKIYDKELKKAGKSSKVELIQYKVLNYQDK